MTTDRPQHASRARAPVRAGPAPRRPRARRATRPFRTRLAQVGTAALVGALALGLAWTDAGGRRPGAPATGAVLARDAASPGTASADGSAVGAAGVSDADGSGTAGSGTAGSGTAGGGAAGSSPAGDGTAPAGTGPGTADVPTAADRPSVARPAARSWWSPSGTPDQVATGPSGGEVPAPPAAAAAPATASAADGTAPDGAAAAGRPTTGRAPAGTATTSSVGTAGTVLRDGRSLADALGPGPGTIPVPLRPPARAGLDLTLRSTDDPRSPWVVVNKVRPLVPADYAPTDLVTVAGFQVRADAADALEAMLAAAWADGVRLELRSGYRSAGYQREVHAGWVERVGPERADAVSARPGYSEHQTGLAVDVGSVSRPECDFQECFDGTAEGAWVADRAAGFGFLLRYTAATQDVTGFAPEGWHLRFVGTDVVVEMRRRGVGTLEELFGLPGGPDYA